jgi:hypothetical protein
VIRITGETQFGMKRGSCGRYQRTAKASTFISYKNKLWISIDIHTKRGDIAKRRRGRKRRDRHTRVNNTGMLLQASLENSKQWDR